MLLNLLKTMLLDLLKEELLNLLNANLLKMKYPISLKGKNPTPVLPAPLAAPPVVRQKTRRILDWMNSCKVLTFQSKWETLFDLIVTIAKEQPATDAVAATCISSAPKPVSKRYSFHLVNTNLTGRAGVLTDLPVIRLMSASATLTNPSHCGLLSGSPWP